MNLLSGLDQFTNGVVLVVGDLMLDIYISGQVSRISPEAPVPVILNSGRETRLGGAGNVAANIVSLSGTARLVGLVGQDTTAAEFKKFLTKSGVPADSLVTTDQTATTTKTRFISGGQQILRYDEETPLVPDAALEAILFQTFVEALPGVGAVVISDYGKGLFGGTFSQRIIAYTRKIGLPCIVDPKGTDYTKYKGATTITPNLKELAQAVRRPVKGDAAVVEAARELIAAYDLDFMTATRSEEGLSIIDKNTAQHFPARAREVFDVSGAGDTVVASMALGLSVGLPAAGTAVIANAAGSIAVTKRGTACVLAQEVRAELVKSQAGHEDLSAETDLASIHELVKLWQDQGLRVGFTNGCFDILHYGHVTLLAKAAAQCDRLVVGMNTDASVRRLKGDSRPVNSEADRAGVLQALKAVDAVILFGEETPLELIRTLKPSVLFKGADYTVETVVGAPDVIANGGNVVLIDLEEGRSTSNIIAKSARIQSEGKGATVSDSACNLREAAEVE